MAKKRYGTGKAPRKAKTTEATTADDTTAETADVTVGADGTAAEADAAADAETDTANTGDATAPADAQAAEAEAARAAAAAAEATDPVPRDPESEAWERRRQRQKLRLEQLEKGQWPNPLAGIAIPDDPSAAAARAAAEAADDLSRAQAVAKLTQGMGSTPMIAAAITNAVAKAIKAGSIPPQWVREGWPSPAGPHRRGAAAQAKPAEEPKPQKAAPPPPPMPWDWRNPKEPRGKIAIRARRHVAALGRESRGLRQMGKELVVDQFGDWLLGQYISLARETAEASETGSLTFEELNGFTKALVTLQRGQHAGQKLKIEQARLELSVETTGERLKSLFEELLSSEAVKARFRPPPISAEERERRINKIFGDEGTPHHIMRKARQQVRAADKASAEAMTEVLANGGTYEQAEEAGHSAAVVVNDMHIKDPVLWGEYGIPDAPVLEELVAKGVTDPELLARAKPGRKLPKGKEHLYTLDGTPYRDWE